MGIMDMFLSKTAAPAQPAQPTPGNIPPGTPAPATGDPATAPNGVVPPGTPTTTPENKTPLDQFADIWKIEPTDPNKTQAGVFGDVDPKKFMEAAAKVNFTSNITPDKMQAIAAGGEEAVKAMMEVMNAVAQNAYAQATFAATRITEQGLGKAKEGFMAELPQHLKAHATTEALRNENPVFSHPAAAPIIDALKTSLVTKYPNASQSELTGMAKQYLEALSGSFAPAAPATTTKTSTEEDWSKFLPGM